MQVSEFVWEPEEIYGEYFNSDIAEFKRTVTVVRVRQAARAGQRVVARQAVTLALFSSAGGAPLECTPVRRFFEHYQIDCMAFSRDGELLALGCGHQVQYVKFNGDRFLPTGRLAGDPVTGTSMRALCFVDGERCLGLSHRALLLFERGVCLSQRELPGGPVYLQGDRMLVADHGVVRLHNALDWEKLEEWPSGSVRALALSAGGRVAWIDSEGLNLREGSREMKAPQPIPSWDQLRLEFAGERLFLSDGAGKVWNLRPQAGVWQEWSGHYLGASGSWWFDQTSDGFRSFHDE